MPLFTVARSSDSTWKCIQHTVFRLSPFDLAKKWSINEWRAIATIAHDFSHV
jgi:hypothetical protein